MTHAADAYRFAASESVLVAAQRVVDLADFGEHCATVSHMVFMALKDALAACKPPKGGNRPVAPSGGVEYVIVYEPDGTVRSSVRAQYEPVARAAIMENKRSDTMTPERLAEIEAYCNAATPGPWEYDDDDLQSPTRCVVDAFRSVTAADDWEFIARARTDLPILVAWAKQIIAADAAEGAKE